MFRSFYKRRAPNTPQTLPFAANPAAKLQTLFVLLVKTIVPAIRAKSTVVCHKPFVISPFLRCPAPGHINDKNPLCLAISFRILFNSTVSYSRGCVGFVPGGKVEEGEKPSYCFISEESTRDTVNSGLNGACAAGEIVILLSLSFL